MKQSIAKIEEADGWEVRFRPENEEEWKKIREVIAYFNNHDTH